jgi:hypothetical protein
VSKKKSREQLVAEALMEDFTPFCFYHVACVEFENGCSAHLAEGRFDPCPYASLADAKSGQYPCVDGRPLEALGGP